MGRAGRRSRGSAEGVGVAQQGGGWSCKHFPPGGAVLEDQLFRSRESHRPLGLPPPHQQSTVLAPPTTNPAQGVGSVPVGPHLLLRPLRICQMVAVGACLWVGKPWSPWREGAEVGFQAAAGEKLLMPGSKQRLEAAAPPGPRRRGSGIGHAGLGTRCRDQQEDEIRGALGCAGSEPSSVGVPGDASPCGR